MKKMLALLLSLCPLALLAQTPRSYLSLSLGRTTPLGAYAGASDFVQSGFARPGAVLSFDAGIYKTKNIGAAVVMSFGSHPFDHDLFRQQLAASGDDYKDIAYTPGEDDAWMSSALMAGPMYGKVIGAYTLEARALGGFYFGKNPDLDFAGEGQIPDALWKFNNNPMDCYGTLGYMLGGAVRYSVNKHLTFRTGLNLYGGKAAIPMKIENDYKFGTKTEREITFSQGATVLDISVGLGYQF